MYWPGPICTSCSADDLDSIAQSRVCSSAGRAEVLEAAEHVEMPLGWKGESGECRTHQLAGAMRAVQPVIQEERAPAVHVVRHLETAA